MPMSAWGDASARHLNIGELEDVRRAGRRAPFKPSATNAFLVFENIREAMDSGSDWLQDRV
jgi:hypothetical protein